MALLCRQPREQVVGKLFQQVGERRQREPGLALGGAAGQGGVAARSVAACRNVVLPMPAVPSSTRADGPDGSQPATSL